MQHDMDMANQAGAAFRADLNNALAALVGLSTGATAPATMFPNMLWYDSSTSKLKKRNNGNTGWIEVLSFDETGLSATLLGAFDVSGLTAEIAPDVADAIAFYDASAAAMRKITLANLLKVIGLLSAETAPTVADLLVLYDVSAGTADAITLQNLFSVINGFTEDTSPDAAADFVLTYDTSANSVKKVKPQNLTGAATLTTIASGSLSGAAVNITSIPATFSSLILRVTGASPSSGSFNKLRVRVSVDNGSSYDTTAANYTLSGVGSVDSLIDAGDTAAAGNIDASVQLAGYQNGPHTHYTGVAEGNQVVQDAYAGSTAAINALQLAWSTGVNFDGGTYALYGVS